VLRRCREPLRASWRGTLQAAPDRTRRKTEYGATFDWLHAPSRTRARRLLGFAAVCQTARRGDPENFNNDGVPAASILSDYRKDIGLERRQRLWDRFEQRSLELYLAGVGPASRVMHLDGFNVRVPGVCPKFDRKTGEVLNADRITVPDGGHQGIYNQGTKGGHGFNVVMTVDDFGVPLVRVRTKMHESEKNAAIDLLGKYTREVKPLYRTDELRVASADAAFAAPELRMAARAAGIIENVHEVSQPDKDVSKKRAKEFSAVGWEVQGYPNWKVNAHRELFCACGHGNQERPAWIDPDGTARVRLKGRCDT
jgi:hypothetical protein